MKKQPPSSKVFAFALSAALATAGYAQQTPSADSEAPPTAVQAGLGPTAMPNSRDYYPTGARRKGLTGRVGVVLSVDEKGRARNIVVVDSGGREFDRAAKELFSDVHFKVPPDWSSTGGPTKLFRYGVVFQFPDKRVAPFEDHRQMVWVTASRLPY